MTKNDKRTDGIDEIISNDALNDLRKVISDDGLTGPNSSMSVEELKWSIGRLIFALDQERKYSRELRISIEQHAEAFRSIESIIWKRRNNVRDPHCSLGYDVQPVAKPTDDACELGVDAVYSPNKPIVRI